MKPENNIKERTEQMNDAARKEDELSKQDTGR